MISPLERTWGVSPAEDRVWSQVSGLAPSKAGGRIFVVLQAYIDDSYTNGGMFVLGGHIASAESWAAFSKEWEEMLPLGTLNKHGRYHFKMSEMAQSPERMSRLPGFFRIIDKYRFVSISCALHLEDLRRAKARIWAPGTNFKWGFVANPYLVTFKLLMDTFHGLRKELEQFVPLDQKVDFYFDNQSEKRIILEAWDGYLKKQGEDVKYFGATPRFEDDEDFLPLQAADFWAWWVRRWYEEGGMPEKAQNCDFGDFGGCKKEVAAIIMHTPEDLMVEFFRKEIKKWLRPGGIIYDIKFSGIQ